MPNDINFPLILVAGLIASGSPGPATLAIASTSIAYGRRTGLALAAGVTTGSVMWSCAAAFGLGALMLANAWLFEAMRYLGGAYLLYLGWKSARSAMRPHPSAGHTAQDRKDTVAAPSVKIVANPNSAAAAKDAYTLSVKQAFLKGLALHLTNPKPVLFFGSLYAIGIPAHEPPSALLLVVAALALQSLAIFHGYALIFSSAPMVRGYLRTRRWFESLLAIAFGVAGLKILFSRTP